MSGYTIVIEGGPITIFIDGHMGEEEAYVEACNKIREALKPLRMAGITFTPKYTMPVKIVSHETPDPRD